MEPVTPETYADVFVRLQQLNLEYVVVGGLAEVMHGFLERPASDLDIAVPREQQKAEAVMSALRSVGFFATLPLPIMLVPVLRTVDPRQREIDVLVRTHVPFQELLEDADFKDVLGARVPVASLAHLIRAKKTNGLPNDLERAERLEAFANANLSHGTLRGQTASASVNNHLSEQLEFRAATDSDRQFLLDLFASTRTRELSALGDDDSLKEAFVKMQYDALTRCYPAAENTIVLLHHEPVGRILIERQPDLLKLVDVALLPEFRNKRIGSFLIQRLLREATEKCVPVSLHVFKSSAAVPLYERNGFFTTGDDGTYLSMQWDAQE